MWDLPGPGIEPVSPALAGGFLTTAPPGKSLHLGCFKGKLDQFEICQSCNCVCVDLAKLGRKNEIGSGMAPLCSSDSQQGWHFPSTAYCWVSWTGWLFIANALTSEAGPSSLLTGVPDLSPTLFTLAWPQVLRICPLRALPLPPSRCCCQFPQLSGASDLFHFWASGQRWPEWRAWGDTSDRGPCIPIQ